MLSCIDLIFEQQISLNSCLYLLPALVVKHNMRTVENWGLSFTVTQEMMNLKVSSVYPDTIARIAIYYFHQKPLSNCASEDLLTLFVHIRVSTPAFSSSDCFVSYSVEQGSRFSGAYIDLEAFPVNTNLPKCKRIEI